MAERRAATPVAARTPVGVSDRLESVGAEAFARTTAPHYHQAASFVFWVGSPEVIGVFPTAPIRLADLELLKRLALRVLARREVRMTYSDLRGFDFDASLLRGLLSWEIPKAIARPRSAYVLPGGWSKAWWVGVIEMGVVPFGPARAFDEPEGAWRWLGAPPGLFGAVEDLTARLCSDAQVRTRLHAALLDDPTLTVEAAARGLGLSARRLQRMLRSAGASYGHVRACVREEIAIQQLTGTDEKIATVAAEAGFRSRSHFVSWFRAVVGETPDRFRRLHRRVK